jgi:hypothetical protein
MGITKVVMAGVQTNQELYAACMKARGYNWQPDKTLSK